MLNHKGTQEIKTKRLRLRRFKVEDYRDMFVFGGNPEVNKYLSYKLHQNPEETKNLLANWVKGYEDPETYNWAIEYEKKVIGSISVVGFDEKLNAYCLGWQIDRPYWNKGIMTEAAKAVIDYLFDVGFKKIAASFDTENIASGRVMQKIGMTKEGCEKNVIRKKDNTVYDRDIYSITNPLINN